MNTSNRINGSRERGPLMKGILAKWLNHTNLGDRLHDEEEWSREVETLYVLLSNYHGTDKLVLKASKLEALKLMCSDELVERVAGLRKIVSDDPTVQKIPKMQEVPQLDLEIGRILGLGVSGFLGSVLEIEAITFAGRNGKGTSRFNETAGSMARDAVFNATAVIRDLTGEDLRNYDVHVNVIGGAKIDGPSAGLATTLAIYSALKKQPLLQDVAVTGEISIQGKVKPVGGIYEKIFGAKQVEVRKVLIPLENMADIPQSLHGIEVVGVSTIEEAMKHVF